LTILVDLTVAIEVGVVLAAILFMHRMSEVVAIGQPGVTIIEGDEDEATAQARRAGLADLSSLPPEIQVLTMRGPLFFGVANRLADVMDRIGTPPSVYIVRMRDVPLIDSSGASRFREFINHAKRHRATVIISGLQRMPRRTLISMHILHPGDGVRLMPDLAAAVALAKMLIGSKPQAPV
jgi:SulP family sulfate permease